MKDPIELHRGDPCPSCGAALAPAPMPTEAQRHDAARRDEPMPLPPHVDTASAEQRAELGELFACPTCHYKARFPLEDAGDEAIVGSEAASPKPGRSRKS